MPPKWDGKTIKAERDARLLTQTEFAALLDVHPQTISDWERDLYEPRRRNQRRLNELFQTGVGG